ncbi:MAG: GMP/IMP nucleotidase [Pseudomonadota bacterium]
MKIDWTEITTVLLDMDGTLLDLHFDNYFWQHYVPQVYSVKHELPAVAAREHIEPLLASHEGTLNWYCVDFWSEQLGLDIMQLKADVSHKIAYLPSAQAFLQYCREEIGDVRLITNGHRKVLNLKQSITGLDQYFDQMVCSHELGAPKEDQAFWSLLQEQKGFEPSRTLFIDDSERVLDSAHEYGIGQIFSIAKPDSRKERGKPSKFPMLENLI